MRGPRLPPVVGLWAIRFEKSNMPHIRRRSHRAYPSELHRLQAVSEKVLSGHEGRLEEGQRVGLRFSRTLASSVIRLSMFDYAQRILHVDFWGRLPFSFFVFEKDFSVVCTSAAQLVFSGSYSQTSAREKEMFNKKKKEIREKKDTGKRTQDVS